MTSEEFQDWFDRFDERHGYPADLPPLVQDDVALARIDENAPLVPYPLLNEDRREASVWALAKYLVRLLWWRWKSRKFSQSMK